MPRARPISRERLLPGHIMQIYFFVEFVASLHTHREAAPRYSQSIGAVVHTRGMIQTMASQDG